MRKIPFLVVLMFFLLCVAAFPQAAGLGGISGVVRDASGAIVPNAKVVVANESKGIRRDLNTNSAGIFNAPALVPASGYVVSVTMQGFNTLEQKDLEVQVGQNVSLTLTLQVAGATTRVEVTEAAQLVEATKTESSTVVGQTEVQELPINGRRFDSFILLTPGVTNDGTYGLVTFRGVAAGNNFLTDGNDTTNSYYQEAPGRTRIRSQISQDAVQEFQVNSAAYMPEFGRASGGVINTVTKSGGNDLHGTFFWFFRNRTLNARDRYATINPPETQHQTGASIGGPIKKDKLFFFLNTEIVRRHNPIASSIVRPAVIDPSGHFLGCAAPATAAQCAAIDSILPRYFGTVDRRADSELLFGKLDWRPNERNSFSANMNYMRFISPNGIQTGASYNNGAAVGSNANSTVRIRYARLSWTSIPTNTMVNEARFGWFKDRQADDQNPDLAPSFGNLTLTVAGQTNLGISNQYPRILPSENRFQYADTLSWTKGKHGMKFGIDVANTQDVTDSLYNRFGTYTYGTVTAFAQDFSGNTTGAKNWQTFSQTFGTSRIDMTTRDWGFFAQDQYRVTPKLTLNYGVRYDYSQLPQPTIVNPDYPQTGRIPSFKGGFGPRIGVAYSIDSSTVVRAGFGLFNARYGGGILNTFATTGNGIYQKSVSYSGSNASDKAAGPVWPNRLLASDKAASGTINLTFAAPDFRTPYTLNGDLSIERQFGKNMGLTVSYLYNRGVHIYNVRDLNIGPLGAPVTYTIQDTAGNVTGTYTTPAYYYANRVDKKYGRVNQVENGANSWYNAMTVQFRRKVVTGVQLWVSYTWAHAIDEGQGAGNDNLFFSSIPNTNLFNGDHKQDKGSGVLDQRHRLVTTFVAQHNFTKRTDAFSKYFVNNWQLSGIATLASSRNNYATISIGTNVAGLTNYTLNGFGGDTRVPFWRVNPLDIQPTYRLDARITKSLPFSERYKLSLNFEAFNVTNTPVDTGVNATAYDANNGVLKPRAGLGTGSASAGFPDGTNVRRAQVSLRLLF